jgi:hypothetical protein
MEIPCPAVPHPDPGVSRCIYSYTENITLAAEMWNDEGPIGKASLSIEIHGGQN